MSTTDQRLDSLDCAIKAVWLLYIRGKWPLLEQLGLSQEAHGKRLHYFRYEVLTPHPHERLLQERDIRLLVRTCPDVIDAAIRLSGQYQVKTMGEHW